jgi:hypothetical protein
MNVTIVPFLLRTGLESDIQKSEEYRQAAETAQFHERLI